MHQDECPLHNTSAKVSHYTVFTSDPEEPEGIALAKAHLWNFEWHETISLMAGLMEEPLDLIQEILKEKDDIFHTQLLLAGRCREHVTFPISNYT